MPTLPAWLNDQPPASQPPLPRIVDTPIFSHQCFRRQDAEFTKIVERRHSPPGIFLFYFFAIAAFTLISLAYYEALLLHGYCDDCMRQHSLRQVYRRQTSLSEAE